MNLTTKILIEIREELKGSNGRLERIDGRLEGIDGRLGAIDKRLDTQAGALVRLIDLAERHETAIAKLITNSDATNARLDNLLTGAHHEAHQEELRRYDELDARVTRLESKRRPA